MEITLDTQVGDILAAFPQAPSVFARHGVDVEAECDCMLDSPLMMCEAVCGIDDIDGLLRDLQAMAAGEA
ncbi:MAG: hypothetical protein ACM3XM_00030 [Mycobacterium leprae]